MMKRICLSAVFTTLLMLPAAALVPIPCVGDAVSTVPSGMDVADLAFRASWRDGSPNWYTAFESKPPKRNPFDRSSEPVVPAETVKGVVWAHGVYCLANVAPNGSEVLVRYYARVAAFYEGERWSRPFENGLLQAYLVKRSGSAWRAETVADERTILLPNMVRSQPASDAIPPPDRLTGIPCRTGTAWAGKNCAVVAVPKAKNAP